MLKIQIEHRQIQNLENSLKAQVEKPISKFGRIQNQHVDAMESDLLRRWPTRIGNASVGGIASIIQ